jgi:hypothetical protein
LRNDLNSEDLFAKDEGNCISLFYLVEMACEEMFGTMDSWGGKVNMDK